MARTIFRPATAIMALIAIAVFAAMLANSPGPSQLSPSPRRFAVPIRLGDHTVQSSLAIECPVLDYNQPFTEFRLRRSPHERRVADLIIAVSANDMTAARRLTASPGSPGPGFAKIEDPHQMLRSHWAGIGLLPDLSNLNIRCRIFWGNRDVFVYEIARAASPVKGLLVFERHPDRGLLWHPFLDDFGVAVLWQIAAIDPVQVANERIDAPVNEYRVRLNPQPSRHDVFMLFNGHDNPEQLSASAHGALKFYETVIKALKSEGTIEDFRNIGNTYYDSHSRNTFLRWIDQDYAAFQRWKTELAAEPQEIIFVMDIEPVFVIFYRLTGAPEWRIHNAFIVQNDGHYYVARLAYSDFLSQMFQHRRNFVTPFLLGTLKNPDQTPENGEKP